MNKKNIRIIPNLVKKKIRKIYYEFLTEYANKSYSQEGEDIVLRRIFDKNNDGFYIDIGAHHPKRFSNTYFFYKKGWKGINIDAMPGSMKKFKKYRKRDINLEIAISDKEEELTYYIFNEPAMNTFSYELYKTRNSKDNYHLLRTKKIKTNTLVTILDMYLPKKTEIDFLSIDVEGLDLRVLKSNNWDKYRPKVVLVECREKNLEDIKDNHVVKFMNEIEYLLYAKTINTFFFLCKKFYSKRFKIQS